MVKSKYVLEKGLKVTPIKSGRPKDLNNDAELVAKALEGKKDRVYKTNKEAAEALQDQAWSFQKKKKGPVGSKQTRISRISRKIGKADKS